MYPLAAFCICEADIYAIANVTVPQGRIQTDASDANASVKIEKS